MNRSLIDRLVCISLCCLSGLAGAQGVGTVAPIFNLEGMSVSVNLPDLRGKVVYLDFWASWCGPCKESFPWMEQLQGKFAQQGLRVVAVNVDKRREDALKFLQNREPQITVVWDAQGITPKAYAVKAMPTSVLISRDGKVLAVHRGFRPEDTAALERQVQLALQTKD